MAEHLPQRLLEALAARAREAVAHWGLENAKPMLLKYRENAVFRITLADGEPAVLRLHRPGYHDESALRSELQWMTALRDSGLAVPSAIAAPQGRLLVRLDATDDFAGQHADIVSWMHGAPLGESGVPFAHSGERQVAIFHALGAMMADMHNLADRWSMPVGFKRAAWDAEGLLGESPVWGRFWDCEGLSAEQRRGLGILRHRLRSSLENVPAAALDYGLIHADLVRENVLVRDDGVAFIDFDDAGFGFRLFDIATALLKNRNEPAYPSIERSLIEGYRSRRPLPDAALSALPLFMTLRSLTYIGWFAARPELPGAEARLRRYADETLLFARTLPVPA
ncbi:MULTISPECIES: phosphotransferase [unclassified Ensifer]|uniref:phosphotransferase enzyme family protein n=1 Tax=unclassified Ensifer TaxID=2633371 RepID=UPI000813AE16|nr:MULTISPECIES: phosphotransferase [unclassified Ensifer]OCP22529.1 homoserine kinase [Ensifer sp. LC384]OCP22909.1 homoserine kinase [Ensifer sp. LC54]